MSQAFRSKGIFFAVLGISVAGVCCYFFISIIKHILLSRDNASKANQGFLECNPFLEKDKNLGWRLKKGYETPFRIKGVTFTLKTNSQGFRSDDEVQNDRGSKFRVICMGDSTVFGMFCDQNDTFPFVLGKELRAIDPKYEVINAGVPGYRTVQAQQYFARELKKYRPNLVIVYVGFNDWDGSRFLVMDEAKRFDSGRFRKAYEKLIKSIKAETDLIIFTIAPLDRITQIEEMNKSIRALGEKHGATVVDLAKKFQAEQDFGLYAEGDKILGAYLHPSPKGHKLISSILLNIIKARYKPS